MNDEKFLKLLCEQRTLRIFKIWTLFWSIWWFSEKLIVFLSWFPNIWFLNVKYHQSTNVELMGLQFFIKTNNFEHLLRKVLLKSFINHHKMNVLSSISYGFGDFWTVCLEMRSPNKTKWCPKFDIFWTFRKSNIYLRMIFVPIKKWLMKLWQK